MILYLYLGQANANVYGELLHTLSDTINVLANIFESEPNESKIDGEIAESFISAILYICEHESGLPTTRELLLTRCQEAVGEIRSVICTSYYAEDDHISQEASFDFCNNDEYIPNDFFERNERTWRGRVQRVVAEDSYKKVDVAAADLRQAVKDDLMNDCEESKKFLKYNYFDNLIALNKKPKNKAGEGYVHPKDRFGKVLSNRWTTEKVSQSINKYLSACENAKAEVSRILTSLAETLKDEGHIPAIIQSSHFILVLSTAYHHAVKANKSKWALAKIIESKKTLSSVDTYYDEVFPYWMNRPKAVSNTFHLNSMILLTAPNMSGKSTLMRSAAAASLLSVCGLCAPLSPNSRIPRFDTLFLRGASSDVPTEDKSAFGAEMEDLAALFRCSGSKSLVFVDELGRGTSPKDGTTLAGAVLEKMGMSGMSGIFATHLHDVLDLPLNKDRITTKRIKIEQDRETGTYQWTHKLEDGTCLNSMALITAERFGLPTEIIDRARELKIFIPERISSGMIMTEDIDVDSISPVHETDSYWENKEQEKILAKEKRRKEFLAVIDLALQLTLLEKSIKIPPRHHPPASLSNESCLYVLQLAPTVSTAETARYYVGETDSLSKRLSQHRRKGAKWLYSNAAVFPVDNKTKARYWESALIGELARAGYSLESISDGRTLRHFRD